MAGLNSRVEFDPAPGIASREILSPSEKRISLIFVPPYTGRVTLGNDPIDQDGNGIVLAAGQASLRLSLPLHGDCVTRSWFALYSPGSGPVGWIQTLG